MFVLGHVLFERPSYIWFLPWFSLLFPVGNNVIQIEDLKTVFFQIPSFSINQFSFPPFSLSMQFLLPFFFNIIPFFLSALIRLFPKELIFISSIKFIYSFCKTNQHYYQRRFHWLQRLLCSFRSFCTFSRSDRAWQFRFLTSATNIYYYHKSCKVH